MDEQRTSGQLHRSGPEPGLLADSRTETFAFVKMLRDYQPEAAFDGHEFGNNQAGDLPVLGTSTVRRSSSTKDLIEGWLYAQGSVDGWYCPYGCQGGGAVGLSQETILRNTMGLKNVVGALLEARSAGGDTAVRRWRQHTEQPEAQDTSALNNYHEFLDYFLANQSEIIE